MMATVQDPCLWLGQTASEVRLARLRCQAHDLARWTCLSSPAYSDVREHGQSQWKPREI